MEEAAAKGQALIESHSTDPSGISLQFSILFLQPTGFTVFVKDHKPSSPIASHSTVFRGSSEWSDHGPFLIFAWSQTRNFAQFGNFREFLPLAGIPISLGSCRMLRRPLGLEVTPDHAKVKKLSRIRYDILCSLLNIIIDMYLSRPTIEAGEASHFPVKISWWG